VPNLITGRVGLLVACLAALNVRRLMYQSLIWRTVTSDEPCRVLASIHSQDLKGLPNPLIDRVMRNPELCGDFLGIEMLVNEMKTVELSPAQALDSRLQIVS
jgi:hypothetical protein